MNKIQVCYNKVVNELTLVSRSDEGKYKFLDESKEYFVLAEKEDLNELVEVVSFLVKTKKEKTCLEQELMDEIKLFTSETIDFIKNQVIEKESMGISLNNVINDELKSLIKHDYNAITADFINNGYEERRYNTGLNNITISNK